MNSRRRYKHPPIEEALCEFRFAASQDWDLTIPGKLQAALGGDYSGRSREQKAIEVGLSVQEGQPSDLRYREGLAKVQLTTADGRRLVGVGPGTLSVHILRPYQCEGKPDGGGWSEFKGRMSKALDAYWTVAEPEGVRRIGVRYINKLVLPYDSVELDKYFVCGLPQTTALPEKIRNFVSRIEYTFPDDVRLVLAQGSVPSSREGVLEFLLDIDVIWEHDEPLSRDRVHSVVEDLRSREREAFESIITDKARGLFDAN